MPKLIARPLAVLAALAVLVATASAAGAQADERAEAHNHRPSDLPIPEHVPGYDRGQAAIAKLGDRLPDVARAFGLTAADLRNSLLTDPTLTIDDDLELAYFDVSAPGETARATQSESVATSSAAAPPTDGPQFQLASLPGADKTIYLDFDGHTTTGTSWNSGNTIVSPPYHRPNGDSSNTVDTWSAEELRIIEDSWKVVAEDFAPWNVNVTTIDPGTEALRRGGSGDTQWGVRVVITDDTWANCGCGGHAYIGAFDDSLDEPVFVYNTSFKGVSEAITHEVGHAMLLAHDGTQTGTTYYTGHGSGETSWAPIMGVAYYVEMGQWSRQEYFDANNNSGSANYGNGRDDTAIIGSLSNGNNFGLRVDDHGDTAGSATALVGDIPSVGGVIETAADVDVFSFSTTGGSATFDASPAAFAPNLDIEIRVRDSAGALVAVGNDPATLAASLTTTLVAGDYTVEIDGVGVGSPANNPPSGYTDYGSLGVYTLSATFDSTPPPPPPPPPPSSGAFANGESTVIGAVTGSYTATLAADSVFETLIEVSSGGKPSRRHDDLNHQWTFTSPGGVQTLSVVADVDDGGDLDDGILLQWSDDGSSWVTLDTLTEADGTVDTSYLLGSPSGTIWVRVIDTDSTPGNQGKDSIAVDLLRIDGEEAGDPTTALVAAMSASEVSAGRGESFGRVTVTVENELGRPVANAAVDVTFTGDLNETATVSTNQSGVATYTTTDRSRKPSFEVCVTGVVAQGLTYGSGEVCRTG